MPYDSRITYSQSVLLPGRQGTEQTLAEMAKIVRRDSRDPAIVALARQIVAGVAPHDEQGEVKAVYDYVKRAIRYVQDPADTEWVQDTRRSLDFGSGDCDDKATALGSLLGAIGFNSRFTVCGYDSDPLAQYDHVWIQTMVAGRWLDLDASEDEYVGWRTEGCARLGAYQIFGDEAMPLGRGLGQDDFYDYSFTDINSDPFADFGWDGDTTTSSVDPNQDPWADLLNDPTYFDPNSGSGYDSETGAFDLGGYLDTSMVYTPDEDIALFDYLQQNFGYNSTSIDDISLQDAGIYTNPDGSYMVVTAAGLEFHNSDGSFVAPVTDTMGMALSGQGLAPAALKQVAQQAAKALSTPNSGASGGGIPIGSSGGQKAPSTAQQPTGADSLTKTLNSITTAIKSALGVTNATGLTHTQIPYGTINPLTGRAYSQNSLITSPQGAGLSLSTSTLLLIGLAFLAFRK